MPSPQGLPDSEPEPGGSFDEISLASLIQVLHARWLAVAVPVLLALVTAVFVVRRQLPTYTARALVQPRVERSPFDNIPTPLGIDRGSVDLGSEMQLLQAEAVLRAVADSLGWRFRLPDAAGARSAYALDVRVDPAAPLGDYSLVRVGQALELRGAGGTVGRAPDGAPVSGTGFNFVPTPRLLEHLPARILIIAPEDAARDLRGSVKVTRLRDTNLLQISCTNADPELAAAVPNVTASVYRAVSAVRARRAATLRREFLARQVAQITDSVMAAQQVLADYQARAKTLDPRTEGEALGVASRAAQTDLRALRFKESILQSLVHALQAPGNSDDAVRRLVAVSQDLIPAGPELYRKLQGFETERGRLTASRYGYTRKAPGVDALDSLIADTKQEMRQVAEQSLGLLRAQLASADERVRELGVREGLLPEQATEFARLKQRADAVEKTFDLLSSKYYEAQTAEAMEGGSVDIAEAALVPMRPDPRHLGRTLLLALALGGILGIFAAFALESLDSSIRRVGDAERITGLEVIGWIPDFRARREIGRVGGNLEARTAAAVAESFRALRTNLRFARAERPQVIAVTSAGPAEGKSTVAENLATALAHLGGTVLLVDADLHRPVLHTRHELPRSPGVTDVLVGDLALEQAIHGMADGLSVLCCGTAAPRPGDLLQSSAFASLVKTARDVYSWVILDTPPVLAVSDAATIGSLADGVLLVARARRTNRHALAQACRTLARCGASTLGLVLNGIPTNRGYGRYSGPGGYYSYSVYGAYSSDASDETAERQPVVAGPGAGA